MPSTIFSARRGLSTGSAIATATARLSSTTGDGATWRSPSYSSTMRAQSVSAAVGATAWHSASAACSAYGPQPTPLRCNALAARSSAATPRWICARSHLVRS